MADLDRKGAAGTGQLRRTMHQLRHRQPVQGRRHDHDAQILTQGALHFQGQCKAEIGIKAPLVELVEQYRPDARKFGIGLQHAGKDTFGHDLDPGVWANPAVLTHAVADRLPDRLSQCRGHACRRRARSQTAGFQHHDPASRQPCLVDKSQRHARRLARAGWRLQHEVWDIGQPRPQLWQN